MIEFRDQQRQLLLGVEQGLLGGRHFLDVLGIGQKRRIGPHGACIARKCRHLPAKPASIDKGAQQGHEHDKDGKPSQNQDEMAHRLVEDRFRDAHDNSPAHRSVAEGGKDIHLVKGARLHRP